MSITVMVTVMVTVIVMVMVTVTVTVTVIFINAVYKDRRPPFEKYAFGRLSGNVSNVVVSNVESP